MMNKSKADNKQVTPEKAEAKVKAPAPVEAQADQCWVLATIGRPYQSQGLNLAGDPQRRLFGGAWAKVSAWELQHVKDECAKGKGTYVAVFSDPTKIPLEG